MDLKDLIKGGRLKVGQKLVWKRRDGVRICSVSSNGTLLSEDGLEFKTPSGAAKYFNGGKNVDGWLVWKIFENEKVKLTDLRN